MRDTLFTFDFLGAPVGSDGGEEIGAKTITAQWGKVEQLTQSFRRSLAAVVRAQLNI